MSMKYHVKTLYLNPILKVWEDEETTPYLKPSFVNWEEYGKIIRSVQGQPKG